jgi:hypothetical protein
MTYIDVLHVYGVSRAGYVPQLFSLRLPNPLVVFELLQKANARALIYDASYRSFAAGCHVPVYVAADPKQVGVELAPLPQIPTAPDGDEIALVFHTSGSTSGSPKLVPCTYAWLNTMISKACQVSHPMTTGRSDVTVWMGSMCHIGQNFSEFIERDEEGRIMANSPKCSWEAFNTVHAPYNPPKLRSPPASSLT